MKDKLLHIALGFIIGILLIGITISVYNINTLKTSITDTVEKYESQISYYKNTLEYKQNTVDSLIIICNTLHQKADSLELVTISQNFTIKEYKTVLNTITDNTNYNDYDTIIMNKKTY